MAMEIVEDEQKMKEGTIFECGTCHRLFQSKADLEKHQYLGSKLDIHYREYHNGYRVYENIDEYFRIYKELDKKLEENMRRNGFL